MTYSAFVAAATQAQVKTDIGREMVRTGMDRADLKYSHEYEAEGLAAENGKVDFWANQFQSPEDFR